MEDIRRETGVRELLPLENDNEISRLPNGVFGYTTPWALNGLIFLDNIQLQQDRSYFGNILVEIHKISQDKAIVLVYITQSTLARLQDPNREEPLHEHAFIEKYKEHDQLVGLPLPRLIMWDSRSAKFNDKEMRFVEIKIR